MSDAQVPSGEDNTSSAIQTIGVCNPNPPQPLPRSRLTVLNKVYVNLPGENTTGPEPISFYRWLESEERPYSRTIKVTEQWQAIDLGWLKDLPIAHIVFENETVRPLGKVPEQLELDEWRDKVLEVGIQVGEGIIEPFAYFPVGEGMSFSPSIPQDLRVRCRKGTGKLTYYIVAG